ncbi:dihydrofolate reductase [Aeromicrobium panaciterrae]|uniref:dihydrofolate reductase n=1 Tax=Aeromicrobium panaciterrae TaxID=363861 RepID=UPI0031E04BFF
MTVTIVVAIGANGVIGNDGDMPWPRTGDQKQFKELTMGHPIVMGRTTYESIGKPLPGRTSIVLTRNTAWGADEGVVVVHTLTDALARGLGRDDEVFLIGGAQVFAEALAHDVVDRMVVTHVHLSPEGDAWFPEVDWSQWVETEREPYDGYDIATYDRS